MFRFAMFFSKQTAHHRQPVRSSARGAHAINREEDANSTGGRYHDVRREEAKGDSSVTQLVETHFIWLLSCSV